MLRNGLCRILPLVLLGLYLFASHANATIFFVAAHGNDGNQGTSWATAKRTIQAAIDQMAGESADEVWVATGIYSERITLKSGVALYGGFIGNELQRDARDWRTNSTIIDGANLGSVITVPAKASSNTVIDGFVIQHGQAEKGGGIYCGTGSAPVIRHNTITNNTATLGGGIWLEGNILPSITDGPRAGYPYVGIGHSVSLSVAASDADGDTLSYQWAPREGGTITGSGTEVAFSPAAAGVNHIDVTVDDQHGGTVTGTVTVTAIGIAIQTPLPGLIVGQASTLSSTVTPAIADSPDYPVHITWTVTSGPAAGTFDPAVNGSSTATEIAFTPSASGPGQLQVTCQVGTASTSVICALSLIPILDAIDPAFAIQDSSLTVQLSGHNLGQVNGVSFTGSGLTASVLPQNQTENVVAVQLSINVSAAPGNRTVILATPEAQFATNSQFEVKSLPAITATPASLQLVVGETGVITFVIPEPAPAGGKGIVLSSTSPIVATVPAAATVPEGQQSVEVAAVAVGAGTTTITANSADCTRTRVAVTVVNPPLITFSPLPFSVGVSLVERCTVIVPSPAPIGGLTVSLTGGQGTIAYPATVTIPAGQSSAAFDIAGLAQGTAPVTAAAAGYPVASLTVTVATAHFGLFPGYLPVPVGRSSSLILSVPNYAPPGGLAVIIACSNPSTATVPDAVTIPAGQKTVSVPVNAVAVGSATVTASLTGFQSATSTVNVLDAFNISFRPPTLYITPGTSLSTDVVISSLAPEGGLIISLISANPTKVTVLATVFIAEGQCSATITVHGVDTSPNPVTVIASCPGLTDGHLSVIMHPTLQFWCKADVTVGAACRTNGAVGLTEATAPAGGYTISLTSSNPAVVSVPATATIPAGYKSANFSIVGHTPGTANITASIAGFAVTQTVTVVTPTLVWIVPASIAVGANATIRLCTSVPDGTVYDYRGVKNASTNQAVDQQALTVTVSSENPAVIQAPATMTIAAGNFYVELSQGVQAAGIGTSTLTASATGWGSNTSSAITVVGFCLKADVTVGAGGCRTSGQISLPQAYAPVGGFSIALISSNPAIASVPATVTIPAGYSYTTFSIVGHAPGTADITALIFGFAVTQTVTVVTPTFNWTVPAQMTAGANATIRLYTSVPDGTEYDYRGVKIASTNQVVDQQALIVTVSSENPAVIQAPATVTIAAGNSYVELSPDVQAVGTGTSTLTASATGWGSNTSRAITVVGPWLKAEVTVGTGCQTTGAVGLTGATAPTGGSTVVLTSSDPTIASVPATVIIPQGSSFSPVAIVGHAPGTADITASIAGFAVTQTVTVVTPTFSWTVPAQMTAGVNATVSLKTSVPGGTCYSGPSRYSKPNQEIVQALTVSLSSENPAVIQAPATATIPAGNNATSFMLQAAGTGTSTLTASAAGWGSNTSSTITVIVIVTSLWFKADVTVGAGCLTTGAVGLTGATAPTGGSTVVLTSSDPTIASVPATVIISQGSSFSSVAIVGHAPGTTDITASIAGFAMTQTVTVVTPTFSWSVPAEMTMGVAAYITLTTFVPDGTGYNYQGYKIGRTNQAVDQQALIVTVSSENPAVIQAPATVTIPAGYIENEVHLHAQAGGIGTSTLTASATGWGSNTSGVITVVSPCFAAEVTVGAGCQTTGVVWLTGPYATAPTGGYTIALTSSNPAVASVPATVTIPQWSSSCTMTIVGHAPGTADITASIAGFSVTQTVTVVTPTFTWRVPAQMTAGTNAPVHLDTSVPGGTGYYSGRTKYTRTDQEVAQALTVTLSSENPAVIRAPATMTIAAGHSDAELSSGVQAVGTGTSTLTASTTGWDSNTSSAITVVNDIRMSADVTVGAGCRTTGAVGLTGTTAPAGGYTLTLTSSNPAVASVPATVTIPAGNYDTTFSIVGHAPGTADITASIAGFAVTQRVTVVTPTFSWSVPGQMTVRTDCIVGLRTYVPDGTEYKYYGDKDSCINQALNQALTVTVSSENPAVIQAPATATIPAGSNATSFTLQAAGIGTSTLTASTTGWSSNTSHAITVVWPWLAAEVTVGAGCQTVGGVGSTWTEAPYTIALTSSNPMVASVPATVTIAGNDHTTFSIVGHAPGTADITASITGFSVTQTVTVVTPTFTWWVPAQMTAGTNAPVYLYTSVPGGTAYPEDRIYTRTEQEVAQALTVTLSSENPAVIQAPATATIPAGSAGTSFTPQVVGIGTSTLTASATGWNSNTSSVITGIGPWLKADVTVGAGCRTNGAVGLTETTAPAGGYTIALTSSIPAIASVPAMVTIPEGSKSCSVTVVGHAPGTASITAISAGFSVTQAVTVVTPTINWTVPASIAVGVDVSLSLHTSVPNGTSYEEEPSATWFKSSYERQPVDQALTVALSSENPAVIQAPATATILAGSDATSFTLQAVGTGTSTLTASATGWGNTSRAITVVEPWLKADVTVGAGCQTNGAVGLTEATAPAGGYTITLTSSNPAVASVPAMVTIPQENSSYLVPIAGHAPGTADITASIAGYAVTQTVTVVTPTFSWTVPASIAMGANAPISLYTFVPGGTFYYEELSTTWSKSSNERQPVDQALTMIVSSENPAVIQAPATATIPAGSISTSFTLQAAGIGTSTLTASAAGWDSNTSSVITVVAGMAQVAARVAANQRRASRLRDEWLARSLPAKEGAIDGPILLADATSVLSKHPGSSLPILDVQPRSFSLGKGTPSRPPSAARSSQRAAISAASIVSRPVIENNVITNNMAVNGGGLAGINTWAMLRNNLFTGNTATGGSGGAIHTAGGSAQLTITGNTITGNAAGGGGGIYILSGTALVTNCILRQNGDDLWNAVASYSCVSDLAADPGMGNIAADPLLAANYRLSPTSPCINAGDPSYTPADGETDIDGEPRVTNSRVDIGADEAPDVTTPNTSITGGPGEGTTVYTLPIEFRWTGTDDTTPAGQLLYSYRLDAEEWTAYAPATSVQLSPANGEHTFAVRARDQAGNVDPTDAVRHFSAETTPLELQLNTPKRVSLTAGSHRVCSLSAPGIDRLFITVQKVESVFGVTASLLEGGQVKASGNSSDDYLVIAEGLTGDAYTLDFESAADGEVIVRVGEELPVMHLGELFIGTIYHNDGSDWVQFDIPEEIDSLQFTVETVGNVSNLDIWRGNIDSQDHWSANQSFNPPIRLTIDSLLPGRYYLRVTDHGLLQDSQVRNYSIRTQAFDPPIVIDNTCVHAVIDPNRACLTSLIFKTGSNCELLVPSTDSYLLEFGKDPVYGSRLRYGWHKERDEESTSYRKLTFAHFAGFRNVMTVSWGSSTVDVTSDFIAPQSITSLTKLLPGGFAESIRDKWAFPTATSMQQGNFTYPGTHAALYPSDHAPSAPDGSWIAFWDDQVDEVYGYTASDGVKFAICNQTSADQHIQIPAGSSRVTFHVIKGKPATPYEAVAMKTASPCLELRATVDHCFVGPGTELTYTIRYRNVGSGDATGVVLEATLSHDVDIIPASITDGGVYNPTDRKLTWEYPTLIVGMAEGILTFRANLHANLPENTEIPINTSLQCVELTTGVSASVLTTIGTPVITSVSPAYGGNTGVVTVTIQGEKFDNSPYVALTVNGITEAIGNTISSNADGSCITVALQLEGVSPGLKNIAVTNNGSQTAILASAFTVNSGGEPRLWVEILGAESIRSGRYYSYTLIYGNQGSVDTNGVLFCCIPSSLTYISCTGNGVYKQVTGTIAWKLGILPPGAIGTQIVSIRVTQDIDVDNIITQAYIADTGNSASQEGSALSVRMFETERHENLKSIYNMQETVSRNSLFVNGIDLQFGSAWEEKYTEFSDTAGAVWVAIYTQGLIKDIIDVDNAAYNIPNSNNGLDCPLIVGENGNSIYYTDVIAYSGGTRSVLTAIKSHNLRCNRLILISAMRVKSEQEYKQEIEYILNSGRVNEVVFYQSVNDTDLPFDNIYQVHLDPDDPWLEGKSIRINPKTIRIDEKDLTIDPLEINLQKHGSLFIYINDCINGKQGTKSSLKSTIVIAIDPNEKSGPTGFDPQGVSAEQKKCYLSASAIIPYVVRYENISTATAAAQEVLVSDQLDANLDWSTFTFETAQIGIHLITVPANSQEFSTDIDLRPDLQAIIQVRCTFNPNTGQARWYFKGVDPFTGLLADFLPPNTDERAPQGEGWLSYSVKPKTDCATGTVIHNKATIDFEVDVPPVPVDTSEVFNTIDSSAPASAVEALPAASPASFTVSWAGQDDENGSGIRHYNIYVSDEGGAYTPWIVQTTAVTDTYAGVFGHTYRFYSVAVDNVGNIEDTPRDGGSNIVPDTETFAGEKPALPAGTSMIAIPIACETADPKPIIGFAGNYWAWWNPASSSADKFVRYPDEASLLGAQTPGRAYWVKLDQARSGIVVRGALADQQAAFTVLLHAGWNMVGNPWLTPLSWDLSGSTITVRRSGEEKSLAAAQAAGWVEDYAWIWQNTGGSGSYQLVYGEGMIPGVTGAISAWRGCWVKALADGCELVFQPPARARAIAKPAPGAWGIRVRAQIGTVKHELLIGETGIDRALKVGQPPDLPDGELPMRLALAGGDAPLAADLRANSSPRMVWEFVVERTMPDGDVILSWPDLKALPRDLALTLVDMATGERRYMRTTTLYRLPAGRTGPQRFQIIAERGQTGLLQIIGLHAQRAREGEIRVAFTLSRAAQTTLTIRMPSGRLLRRITPVEMSTAGDNVILWNGRGEADRLLQRGLYLLEIHAVDEEHRQFRAITTVNLR